MTTTAIGIMSGTSLDGLDLAYCTFTENSGAWHYTMSATRCVPYDDVWKARLSTAHGLAGDELTLLDADFGRYMAVEVMRFLEDQGLPAPELVASHGHTVFHSPERGFTLQIGSGVHLAAGTGITTVFDFRSLDVALGGQGAPLVPLGDHLLFSEYNACLNLGGFSNVSFEQSGLRRAFDICAVNIVLNRLAEREGVAFDRDGAMAASGTVLSDLLHTLNGLHDGVTRPSLSREWVENGLLTLLPSEAHTSDLLRTVTEYAAHQMAQVINDIGPVGRVLVTGGGAYNTYLMDRMRQMTRMDLVVPDSALVEFKEALVFALLGVLRSQGLVNVLRSVTGASDDSCSGSVVLIRR